MKAFRKLFSLAFLLIACILCFGLLMPGEWSVEQEATIRAPADRVFARVADLRGWEDWAIMFEHDPAMETTFSDPSSGVGATFAWAGNTSVGSGDVTLVGVDADQRIDLRLTMDGGSFVSEGAVHVRPDPVGVRVTWTLGGTLGADPFARLNRSLLERSVAATLQGSLAKLKQVAESEFNLHAVPATPGSRSVLP